MDKSKKKSIHPRSLSRDSQRQPVIPNDGDEHFSNGVFQFNITALLDWLAHEPQEVIRVPINIWRETEKEEAYVEQADITRPIVIAEIAPDYRDFCLKIDEEDWIARGYCLIDGYHRVKKARRLGVDTLPAIVLRMEQHIQFMYDGYDQYVDYWNEKLAYRQEQKQTTVLK